MANWLSWLKSTFVKNVDLAIILFFCVLSSGYFLLIASPSLFSYIIVFSIILMLIGQIFLVTSFGQAYFFYFYSFFLAITFSVLFWLASHLALDASYVLLLFIVIIAGLSIITLIIHVKTRKRVGTIPLIPVYSISFLGLILVLSTSGNNVNVITSASFSDLFILTIVLFIITSIFGLNIAYRTLIVNKKLKISNYKRYAINVKEELRAKYKDKDSEADIDLLTYYLSSALEAFIYGDFDRGYMDAFKIIDNKGTAFGRIYTPNISDSDCKRFNETRKYLSHAKIKGENEVKTQRLADLREIKKGLFNETLDILEFIRFNFIDKALSKESAPNINAQTS